HLSKNTIVIYTTDNGIYLGEHELADKRTAYDECLRIPMLVRWPGHIPAGEVLNQMVLNIDVPETLIDYAGLPVPKSMQGMSWKPLLENKDAKWRHSFFYEYFHENHYDAPTTLAVRTDTAKLIEYLGHPQWAELFDLKDDPYETHNLVQNPADAALLGHMEALFTKDAKIVRFRVPPYADPYPY
ncbi:MAG TPA: sulfatase/phosphatase domain-containing protein, partial [Tepidisphaeraceae bacterium]|nr:sulfatase/phosphatase domain-containing protein [Tepidisphaeraceae bacterium]